MGLEGIGANCEDGLLWGLDQGLETPKYLKELGCGKPELLKAESIRGHGCEISL